jgi:hypothetical protein
MLTLHLSSTALRISGFFSNANALAAPQRPRTEKEFSHLQETELGSTSTERLLRWVTQSQHKIFAEGEEVMKSDKILGEAGCGIVEQVTLPTEPQPLICVRKKKVDRSN